MNDLMVFLLKKRAHKIPLRMSSIEIGKENGMSQQNASRRLLILEKEGKIRRNRRDGIILTDEGVREMKGLTRELYDALEDGLRIGGVVVSGMHEGRKFLSMKEYKDRINKAFGFVPFPGTLNIRLSGKERMKRSRMLAMEPKIVDGFEKEGRRYGDLYCYKCTINGIEGVVVFPLKTRHGSEIIEVIASDALRKTLGLKDGSRVELIV
jgi:riboflavin kinase